MQTDLVRKQYDFELDQRNSIASITNLPVVAITIVASASSVVLLDYRYEKSIPTYLFALFIGLCLVAIAYSVFCVFKSFWNYEYQKLPGAAQLKQHYDALVAWGLENGCEAELAKKNADADFAAYVSERLAEAADWNGQNNVVRGNYLHKATASVAIAVASLLPAASIYAHNKATAEDKTYQVRLVDPLVISIKEPAMTSKPTTSSSQPAAPAPAPAPAPSAKPSGPPNTVFKGGSDLIKPSASTGTGKK